MAERGIDLTAHSSCRLTRQIVEDADLILGMTRNHVEAMRAAFPYAQERIHLLAAMAREGHDVANPYERSIAAYRATASELERLIQAGQENSGR